MDENEYKVKMSGYRFSLIKFVIGTVLVSVVATCLNHQIQKSRLDLEEYNSQTRYLETFLPSYSGATREQKLDFLQFMMYANPDTEAASRYKIFYAIIKDELDTINKQKSIIDSLKKEILILKVQIDSINIALKGSTNDRKSLISQKQKIQEKLNGTIRELDRAYEKLKVLKPDEQNTQVILPEFIDEEKYRLVTSKVWRRNGYEFTEIGLFSDIGIYYPEFEPMKLGIRYTGVEAYITVYGMKSFSLKHNESVSFTFDTKTKYKFTLLSNEEATGSEVILKIDQFKRK